MKYIKKIALLFIVFCIFITTSINIFASSKETVSNAVSDTASYLLKTVKEPQIASLGGEWTIIGLSRSKYSVPQSYYDTYYKNVEKHVKELKGKLHNKKYTEYSRVVIALTAIGKDPTNVSGYNLLEPLGDFDKTIAQGINGPIFALIALDSGNYKMPISASAKTKATREMYVDEILSRQLKDGGFSLSGTSADPDITGMALQALAKYQDKKTVKSATDKALKVLSTMQDSNGGYGNKDLKNSESTAQVLMALCELGIDINDSRFVKNGNSVSDNLLTYYQKGNGFKHLIKGDGVNLMSTEQAFYGLVNLERISDNKTSLYRMAIAK